LCFETNLSAQHKKKNYFPFGTYHKDSINIDGISVGLGTWGDRVKNTNTNGIKIEAIGLGILVPLIPHSPIVEDDSSWQALQKEPISERINGLVISASGTVCHCITNGISVGYAGQINYKLNGFSYAGFFNFSQQQNGVMAALFFNQSYIINGVQIGFVGNTSYHLNGIQISGINETFVSAKGIQIGLINKSAKLKGIQLGLWNVNQKRKFPLFNWAFS
jgi:hypothetical protein